MVKKQLVIIGLDGLDFNIVQLLLPQLPTFRRLVSSTGAFFNPLKSCDPPITVPAWSAMSTGKTPGELGIYGFTNKCPGRYQTFLPDASHITAPRVWDILGAHGLRSIIIGMPQTAPAAPLPGYLVGGNLAGSGAGQLSTWPGNLRKQVDQLAGGKYLADTFSHRRDSSDKILAEARLNTSSSLQLAASLAQNHDWNLLWTVIMAPDRLQHAALPREISAAALAAGPLGSYYRFLDRQLEAFIKKMPPKCPLVLLSDHGTLPCHGSFWLNRWLVQENYLVLKNNDVPAQSPFSPDLIDWSRTKVYGQGGYYGRLYINLKGREEAGLVGPAAKDHLKQELAGRLAALATPWPGRPNIVLDPQEIYPECNGQAPDLMVYPASLSARAIGLLDNRTTIWNDQPADQSQLDHANHSHDGLFLAANCQNEQLPASLYEIVPFIMNILLG